MSARNFARRFKLQWGKRVPLNAPFDEGYFAWTNRRKWVFHKDLLIRLPGAKAGLN